MALEQGDSARFLQETSFSNVSTPTYPPPCSPIDCEMQEYQRQYNSVKLKVNRIYRNVKIMGILSLVSLAIVFCLVAFDLLVDLEIPNVIQFLEEHFGGSGSENEVLGVQPDLSLNLVVHTKAPSFSAPKVKSDDLSEDSGMQILDLTPHLWD